MNRQTKTMAAMTTSFQNMKCEVRSSHMAEMVRPQAVADVLSTLRTLDRAEGGRYLADVSARDPALFLGIVGAAIDA